MKKQTLIWTALPHRIEGPVAPGATLRLSLALSPRLWNDDPTVAEMTLAEFPDLLDWPATLQAGTFAVQFDTGLTLPATPDLTVLDTDVWQALFKASTRVVPFRFEDYSGSDVIIPDSTAIADAVKGVYQTHATDPASGGGATLPPRIVLAADPTLVDIARPVAPFEMPPLAATDPGPVEVDSPSGAEPPSSPDPTPPDDPDTPTPQGDGCRRGCGCSGCLLMPFRILARLILMVLQRLGLISAAAPPIYVQSPNASFATLQAATKPFDDDEKGQPMPTAQEIKNKYDFHSMVAMLGDYPALLRATGLIVDVSVTLGDDLPPATGTVQVVPTVPLADPTVQFSPQTHYEVDDTHFFVQAAPTSDAERGWLRLEATSRFSVQQLNAYGSGLKLLNLATNIVGLTNLNEWPALAGEEVGLPALQTVGLSLIRRLTLQELIDRWIASYALQRGLAAEDNSPTPPWSGSGPVPGAKTDVFADDVTRGYRLDVWDDKATRWLSLSQRAGRYAFGDDPNVPDLLREINDEGFVQFGGTEPLNKKLTFKATDALATWDGWSLAAPRPINPVLTNPTDDPQDSTGPVANPPVTDFKLSTTFQIIPGTLPRLRLGYNYRLRARLVDLAGNSVTTPAEATFSTDAPHGTPAERFRRFEPIAPPALLLRAAPKEGESLERITVRSQLNDAMTSVAPGDRHLVPPKTSQLMAEYSRKFDASPAMPTTPAAYDLAAREGGTLTHTLNPVTKLPDLLLPGVSEVTVGENTQWIQANAIHSLSYLPDPYGRGIVFYDLPGVAATTPYVALYGGTWPDLEPLRLRIAGIVAGAAPATPAPYDPTSREIIVEVPQGETFLVRYSSLIAPNDVNNLAVWRWIEEALAGDPVQLADMRQQAGAGLNWLLMPYRTLTLVHAVQQPLAIPEVQPGGAPFTLKSKVGDTFVTVQGQATADGKSTAKLDLFATWQDPIDDLSKVAYDPATDILQRDQQVAELTLHDPTTTLHPIGPLRQEINDTRYHRVSYFAHAASRFREYFDYALPPASLIRPLPGIEAPILFETDVLNSARPDSPRPLYALPTFRWERNSAGNVYDHTRHGGGLRLYMQRPWFSSGAGELISVVLRSPIYAADDPRLPALTSEWAMDPLWEGAGPFSLQRSDLRDEADSQPDLTLAEGLTADVVAYAPAYDSTRNLWYADLTLGDGNTYFPFVRLALARYQRNSIADCHLSPIVLADIVQIVPTRRVRYTVADGATDRTVTINVRGTANWKRQQIPNRVVALVQHRRADAPGQDELGWETSRLEPLPIVATNWPQAIWQADVTVAATGTIRILVLELEDYAGDSRIGRMDNTTATVAGGADNDETPTFGDQRPVFADSLMLL